MIKKYLISVSISMVIFFILDRFLKIAALSGITKKFLFVNFFLTTNPNIALSIPLRGFIFYLLLIIIFFIVIAELVRSYQSQNKIKILSLSLILTGAISNVLDRVRYGAVIDYFNLPFLTIFNLSDLMILAGIIILIWQLSRKNA